MITTIILTHNEESSVAAALKSVMWTDEILVIDDYSTDKTVAIAQRTGPKVYPRALNGDFASQRNFGLEQALGDWVLFVDADEIVPKSLADEIIKATKSGKSVQGYYLRRRDHFLGQAMAHGETGNIKLMRLGRKGSGQWTRKVHEKWQVTGSTETLVSPLEHYSHQNIGQFIKRINAWTEIDAEALRHEGKHFSVPRLILNPSGKFLDNYFLKLGMLDGVAGFVMAFMMSLYSLIVRVKQFERLP